MKNILFIHQSAELYGSDKTLLILLTHINRTLYNPVVVLPCEGLLTEKLKEIKVEYVVAPVLKLYRDIFKPKNVCRFVKEAFICLNRLNKLEKKYHFDIVYSNTLAVLSGGLFAKLKGIKHIWHVHEIIVHPTSVANLYPKLLFRFSDVVVCNSKATLINLTDRLPDLAQKSVVVYNGVAHHPKAINNAVKSDYGFKEEDVVLTLLGRISKFKGHKWLLSTYQSHLMKYPNLKLLFVGSPVPGQEAYLDEITAYIRQHGFEDRVTFISFTQEVSAIWQVTDIAIMPSYEPEPFGLVAIEAMLAKKPVIGANHGGLMEIIVDQKTGYLIEPNNNEKLAAAICSLTEDKAKRILMGEKGYERVIQNFSIQKYTSELEAIFNRL